MPRPMHAVALLPARLDDGPRARLLLSDLGGWPVLYRAVERARLAATIDEVAVITTTRPLDDPLAHFCDDFHVACCRLPASTTEECCQAARRLHAGVIVRLVPHCPWIDPQLIDQAVRTLHAGNFDYVSNTLPRTYPAGLEIEVVKRAALERACRECSNTDHAGDVLARIVRQPDRFRLHNIRSPQDLSALRWVVETPEELEAARTSDNWTLPAVAV